jgi:hypothetical protein
VHHHTIRHYTLSSHAANSEAGPCGLLTDQTLLLPPSLNHRITAASCCILLPVLCPGHLGATKEYLPSSKGFDSYYGIPYSVDMGLAYNNRTEESWSEGGGYYGCTPLPLMANYTVLEQPVDLAHVHEKYTAQAVDFVTTSLKDKAAFFLYFA